MMNQIFLIVRGEGIDDDIDSQLEGRRPLNLISRHTFVDPLAKFISCPRSREVILRVDHWRPVIHQDPFQVRVDLLSPSHVSDQIKSLKYRMVWRKSFKLMVRQDLFYLLPKGLVESKSFGPHGVFDEKEPTESDISPQHFPLSWSERLKGILPCHVKEGTEEEIRVGEGCDAPFLQGIDARPEFQLLDDGLHKLRIRIPFSTAIPYLAEKELGEGSSLRGLRERR